MDTFVVRFSQARHSKAERLIKLLHQTKQLLYTIYLYLAILILLLLQFGTRIKTMRKILWNSIKYSSHTLIIPPNFFDKAKSIISPTTQVYFRENRRTGLPLCLKVWQRQRIRGEVENEIHYLLEGFIRNHHFAGEVYLGFAYFIGLSDDAQTYQYGSWTLLPRRSKLANGKYTYLMKALEKEWRLDRCLYKRCLFEEQVCVAQPEGMKFLAEEVARLHRHIKKALPGKGTPESIANKQEFNRNFFEKAVEQLDLNGFSSYSDIIRTMKHAVKVLAPDFQRRFEQGHIRACHGDLKLTNIWIRPASAWHPQQQLFALDCIDFNPDFYCIDTLSDVAMLVMDLRMHLDRDLVEVFIKTYLQVMEKDEKTASPLLMYYAVEKAIVCANVSILLDKDVDCGKQYFTLAQELTRDLERLLPPLPAQYTDNEEPVYPAQLTPAN